MGEAGARQPGALPRRDGGRVILIDGADRVLLLRTVAPGPDGVARVRWVLPGGGAEAGESRAAAAARELREETGLRIAPGQLRGPVARTRGVTRRLDVDSWGEADYFFLRVAAWVLAPGRLDPPERTQAADHRWWPVAELLRTDALVLPRGLGPLIVRLLAGDVPTQPVELPW